MLQGILRVLLMTMPVIMSTRSIAQYPATCADVGSRANSNGQATSCPNVSGTLYAANFVGTSYATVPAQAKTGNLQLKYAGASISLKPFAITRIWQTNPTTTLLTVPFGPAGVPSLSGTDIVVSYCFYGNNLPSLGTLSLELTNPETGVVWGICSYDASCTSGCTVVANPPVLLPVLLSNLVAKEKNGTVELNWACEYQLNNKGFTIKRSTNGTLFNAIGFVGAQTGSGGSVKYEFTDAHLPAATTAWYRIRQEDMDGTFTYTKIMTVNTSANKPAISIYGHEQSITVVFPAVRPLTTYNIMVYDLAGRIIQRES